MINRLRLSQHSSVDYCWSLEQFKSTWSYKHKNLDDCIVHVHDEKETPLDLDFSGFKLHRTQFHHMDLSETRFKGAYCSELTVNDCRLTSAYFREAFGRLHGCVFGGVTFLGPLKLKNKWLNGTALYGQMPSIDLDGAEIQDISAGSWLTADGLKTTNSYTRNVLVGCRFSGSDFRTLDFSQKVIVNCQFVRCDLADCDFDNAVISGTSFVEHCPGLTAAQIKSTWNFRNDRMETVTLPPDIAEQLKLD